MDDPLITAANRMGIATHASAGPGEGPAGQRIWARWPRPRMDIAHEALERAIETDGTAGVAPCGHANRWRAYSDGWSYEGEFVEAVATLALHVSDQRETGQKRTRSAGKRSSSSH